MCPDEQILSTYYDNELDYDWTKRIAGHIEKCPECQEKVSSFSRLSLELNNIDMPDITKSSIKIREQIKNNRVPVIAPPFWKRRFNVSLPMAVAAGVAIFILSFSFSFLLKTNPDDNLYKRSSNNFAVDFNSYSREELIKYLNSEDSNIEVKMKLPEDSNFEVSGEPELIRFIEYDRGE